jgi:hypothetical protein
LIGEVIGHRQRVESVRLGSFGEFSPLFL